MTISWKGMFNYIFPPFRLLHRILHKIREDGCKTILIAPAWSRQSWFPDLLLLSCAKPLIAPVDCLTAPEMRLVAFSEKPLCLIKVLTATMRADGVSPGLDEASFP
jgi:hypothetical protein